MTQIPANARPIPTSHAVDHFEDKAVSLFELFKANLGATGEMTIRNKTFERCTIEGPAVLLALGGVEFDACELGKASDDPRQLLLKPMMKGRLTGAIAFQDCVFRNCRFFAVGYTGSDAFLDRMIEVLTPEPRASV